MVLGQQTLLNTSLPGEKQKLQRSRNCGWRRR